MGGNLRDFRDFYSIIPLFPFTVHISLLDSLPILVIPSQLFPTEVPGALIHFWFFITYSNFQFPFCASVVLYQHLFFLGNPVLEKEMECWFGKKFEGKNVPGV